MGVDFYSCAICGHNFPDCGDYVSCEHCYNHFCSDECAQMEYLDEDEDEDEETDEDEYPQCCICRKEEANDYILLEALLKHFNLTRKQALEIWQKQPDDDDDNGE